MNNATAAPVVNVVRKMVLIKLKLNKSCALTKFREIANDFNKDFGRTGCSAIYR